MAPDRLWVAEIKYVQTREGYLFLAAVIDAARGRCVGRSMRDDLKTELVLGALGMAISKRRAAPGLVHHSDRGSPYTSLAFGKTLQHAGALPGMGRRGDAYDNALAEGSSPPSRPSCSSDTPSTPATTPGSRSSTTSKASTTPAEATPRSATSAPTDRENNEQQPPQNSHRCLTKRCQPNRGNSNSSTAGSMTWVGLDVHARASACAVLDLDSGEVVVYRHRGCPSGLGRVAWLARGSVAGSV